MDILQKAQKERVSRRRMAAFPVSLSLNSDKSFFPAARTSSSTRNRSSVRLPKIRVVTARVLYLNPADTPLTLFCYRLSQVQWYVLSLIRMRVDVQVPYTMSTDDEYEYR